MATSPRAVETPAAEAPKRKRRSFSRGPRVATILCHVADGKPVIDLVTFTAQGLDILDKFSDLQKNGHDPQVVRYTMPASTAKEAEDNDDEG